MNFWNYSQWNISMISNFKSIYSSFLFRFNRRWSINMNWSNYNRNVCLSFNSNCFDIFSFSWYIVFSVNCKYRCRFLNNLLNFMLKDWSICFWNNLKRNISFISNFECRYFSYLIYNNFLFDWILIFNLIYRNVYHVSNNNLLMSLINDRLVKLSINFYRSRMNSFLSYRNGFINKDWLVCFWYNF